MQIINSTIEDISTIFQLYNQATELQKAIGNNHWMGFERALVEQEIAEGRQWKIVIDGAIACVFMTAFNDPYVWNEKDKDPAVYIHRIATNEAFRGQGLVKAIVAWTKDYARQHQKRFVRIDTGSGNDRLINYYKSCGFVYQGEANLQDAGDLPEHYKQGGMSLLEIDLG